MEVRHREKRPWRLAHVFILAEVRTQREMQRFPTADPGDEYQVRAPKIISVHSI
jgi:hypothetical protein